MELTDSLINPLGSVAATPPPAVTTAGNANFPVESQQMSNWCWAASAMALNNFYGPSGQFTQQDIVAGVLQMPLCAIGPPNPICNNTADFSDALTFIHHLQTPAVETPIELPALIAQLINNNPVGCQMNLPGIGGHIILVVEVTTDAQGQAFVTVADPADGTLPVMTYNQLRTDYRGSGGQWIRTYLTN